MEARLLPRGNFRTLGPTPICPSEKDGRSGQRLDLDLTVVDFASRIVALDCDGAVIEHTTGHPWRPLPVIGLGEVADHLAVDLGHDVFPLHLNFHREPLVVLYGRRLVVLDV